MMINRILILCLVCCFSFPAFAADEDVITIDGQDQLCSADEDCVVVETKCKSNGCECGEPVNKAQFPLYRKKLDECRAKQEMMATCDYLCPTPYPRCVDGQCVLSAQAAVQNK